jgi:PTH2 family peptidyl-tRNA hydrolase
VIEPKQVIVMRKDLNMRKGKMCAQAAHASMAALLNAGTIDHQYNDQCLMFRLALETGAIAQWVKGKFTKIVVSVDSDQELLDIYNKVVDSGIKYHALITDSGATEFGGVPTITCMAIGPDWPEVIDPITSHLKLL